MFYARIHIFMKAKLLQLFWRLQPSLRPLNISALSLFGMYNKVFGHFFHKQIRSYVAAERYMDLKTHLPQRASIFTFWSTNSQPLDSIWFPHPLGTVVAWWAICVWACDSTPIQWLQLHIVVTHKRPQWARPHAVVQPPEWRRTHTTSGIKVADAFDEWEST